MSPKERAERFRKRAAGELVEKLAPGRKRNTSPPSKETKRVPDLQAPGERVLGLRDVEVAELRALMKALDRRVVALEDAVEALRQVKREEIGARHGAFPPPGVVMNPAMGRFLGAQPRHPTSWQGRPVRSCCGTVEGFPHSDTCEAPLGGA